MGKPPKWMVSFMENPIKMDDLRVPLFLETPIYISNGNLRPLYHTVFLPQNFAKKISAEIPVVEPQRWPEVKRNQR